MSSPALQAENVAFYYPQQRRGLTPVSLCVSAGEGLLVNGLSGSGKSTLARCLSGLIPHLYRGEFQGAVWVNGKKTDQSLLWELAEQAGLVFQNPALQMLAATVEDEILFGLENLGIPRDEMRTRLEETLESFELGEMRKRSPHTLSGGEQQKLALAAISARRPQTLILDEPLSMLDTTSALEFVACLEQTMHQGTAVIVCEHRQKYLQHLAGMRPLALNGQAAPLEPASLADEPYPYGCAPFTLEVRNLAVQLGGKKVLENIDFTLAGGQVVALVGRNGAGKTTLLRALAGLQHCQGEIVAFSDGEQAAPRFSMIFQNPDVQLFNPTVCAEICYRIPNPDRSLYAWLMRALDLERYAETPPLLLSEGEKRRVALATALMHQARHGVLLDEPSLGQDAAHKQILYHLLHSLAGAGALVIFSTHDLELAAMADQVILLQPGGILRQGVPGAVFADQPAWQQMGLRKPDWMRLPCSA